MRELDASGISEEKLFYHRNDPIPGLDLLPIKEVKGDPVIAELVRKLPALSGAFLDLNQEKIVHERLWTSVIVNTGNYYSTVNSYYYNAGYGPATYSATLYKPSVVNGFSHSLGVLGGARVTKRLVLQLGVQYLTQSVGSTSNINATGSLSTVANYAANPGVNVSTTSSPYNIISTNQFVAVPALAGYLLIDEKVGLQLNVGVSSDFFLRNSLTDPSGRLQSYSQGAGQNSPYRSVNFSGLAGSELSYRPGGRYRVSLVPGFRYPFGSVLKSGANSTGNSWLWDMGFRLRYIFK
jgi:hypothetical protein